jgi:hypothetical protein
MGAKITFAQIFPLPNPMTGASLSTGLITFPNGFIIQWGYTLYTSLNQTIPYAISFPNAVFSVVITPDDTSAAVYSSVHNVTVNDFIVRVSSAVNGCHWIAIGY